MNSFNLIPFTIDHAPSIKITGDIKRHHNQLKLEYKLAGVSQVRLPKLATNPTRQFNLWESTCFEFFLGLKNSTKYWEFNLSPSGNWNVFRFLEYRQNIVEELAFDTLSFQVWQQDDILQLQIKFNLDQIIDTQQSLVVGITTVVEDLEKNLTYWALNHTQPEADFHHRDDFIINL